MDTYQSFERSKRQETLRFMAITLFLLLALVGGHISLAQADQVDDLIHRLKSQNVHERQESARALGKLSDPRVVEPLIALLQDREVSIRLNAIDSLRRLRDRRAVLPLMQVFKEDSSLQTRIDAAEALGVLGDQMAMALLTEFLINSDRMLQSKLKKPYEN
jgi:HEAT repeat protein